MTDIDRLVATSARSSLHGPFYAGQKGPSYLERTGLPTWLDHTLDSVGRRLAPAYPVNDGRPMSFRGHPAFVVQHATLAWCHLCLANRHHIAPSRPLGTTERVHMPL